jgi:hypothetical protein
MSVFTPRQISRVVRHFIIHPHDAYLIRLSRELVGGGCSIPLHEDSPRGRDCSSIPGVTDVSCYNGACRVDGCMPGYRVSSNRRTCYNDEQLRIIKELIPTPYKLSVDLI